MRRAALAVVVFGVLAGPALAEELGPGFVGYSITSLAGLGAPSGQHVDVGTVTGTLDFENDSSPLEHAALHCVGGLQLGGQGQCAILTMVEGGAEETESDEGFDPGLNHLFASYECTEAAAEEVPAGAPGALRCALTIIEGNGAFEGATGSATLIATAPVASHPDGSASAYAMITSFDLVLPQ